mmetsp:Transcript_4767/g.10225  ORF Transcript_4767/g.10225 Transcript_4767/m.10225 type:complete len:337 (-) Transcript_4767:2266-3276(-)
MLLPIPQLLDMLVLQLEGVFQLVHLPPKLYETLLLLLELGAEPIALRDCLIPYLLQLHQFVLQVTILLPERHSVLKCQGGFAGLQLLHPAVLSLFHCDFLLELLLSLPEGFLELQAVTPQDVTGMVIFPPPLRHRLVLLALQQKALLLVPPAEVGYMLLLELSVQLDLIDKPTLLLILLGQPGLVLMIHFPHPPLEIFVHSLGLLLVHSVGCSQLLHHHLIPLLVRPLLSLTISPHQLQLLPALLVLLHQGVVGLISQIFNLLFQLLDLTQFLLQVGLEDHGEVIQGGGVVGDGPLGRNDLLADLFDEGLLLVPALGSAAEVGVLHEGLGGLRTGG